MSFEPLTYNSKDASLHLISMSLEPFQFCFGTASWDARAHVSLVPLPAMSDHEEEEAEETQTQDAASRERYKGPIEAITAAIREHFKKHQSLKYPKVKVDAKIITSKRVLVQSVEKVQKNLAFTRDQMDQAMMQVAVENNKAWQVADENVVIWANDHSKALRNMLMAVQRARSKKQPPGWVAELELPPWRPATTASGPHGASTLMVARGRGSE